MVLIVKVTFYLNFVMIINLLMVEQMYNSFLFRMLVLLIVLFYYDIKNHQVGYLGNFRDKLLLLMGYYSYRLMQVKNLLESNRNQENHYNSNFSNAHTVSEPILIYLSHFNQ